MIKLKGKQTTNGAGVFYDESEGIKCNATLNTDGRGLWSNAVRAVKINAISLSYVDDEDFDFGELRVFFNRSTWRTERHGLIYTDDRFEKELQKYLKSLGLAGKDVSYSEQGMQGDNYVSCDVGKEFIDSWIKVIYNGDWRKFVNSVIGD